VWDGRNGMWCYSVKLVGGSKIWVFEDGYKVWD
jgi:hypothetical protein